MMFPFIPSFSLVKSPFFTVKSLFNHPELMIYQYFPTLHRDFRGQKCARHPQTYCLRVGSTPCIDVYYFTYDSHILPLHQFKCNLRNEQFPDVCVTLRMLHHLSMFNHQLQSISCNHFPLTGVKSPSFQTLITNQLVSNLAWVHPKNRHQLMSKSPIYPPVIKHR